jgi:ribosome-binding factor A
MSDKQKARIEETIHQLIAELLMRRVKDPRVTNVSITQVSVSKDYSVAKIGYNVLGGEPTGEIAHGLESCKGFLRGQIKKHLRMRVIPELVFQYDASLDRAMEIEELFKRIDEERDTREGGDTDA